MTESHENLAKLTDIRRIHHLKVYSKSMQCFHPQNFGHKAEHCNLKERYVKSDISHNRWACVKPVETPPKCTNCGGEHLANYRGCTAVKERRGATRTPSNPLAPKINSSRNALHCYRGHRPKTLLHQPLLSVCQRQWET